MLKLIYCLSCGKKLTSHDIADVNAAGYKCDSGHYLNVLKDNVRTAETGGKYLKLISGKQLREEIIREWLSNSHLRNHLNDSLANVLRYIIEKKGDKKTSIGQRKYDFCPLCGSGLKDEAVDDLYIAFLKCPNGHSFISRHGLRFFDTKPSSETIDFDFTAEEFKRNISAWTKNANFQQYVPDELKTLLHEFMDSNEIES